jgi:hypothetical protein
MCRCLSISFQSCIVSRVVRASQISPHSHTNRALCPPPPPPNQPSVPPILIIFLPFPPSSFVCPSSLLFTNSMAVLDMMKGGHVAGGPSPQTLSEYRRLFRGASAALRKKQVGRCDSKQNKFQPLTIQNNSDKPLASLASFCSFLFLHSSSVLLGFHAYVPPSFLLSLFRPRSTIVAGAGTIWSTCTEWCARPYTSSSGVCMNIC